MSVLTLSQIQFALTSIYHFFFVPLTLGLSVLVAIMESFYVGTGKEMYKDMARFWGKLLIINFALGVVTGIVQEFQFGMNWSGYSRFVGDIFGAPLAIEALLAFFLESTFIGLWVFGWKRLSKGLHLAAIWLVAFAANLSALWILIANSFMQNPTGYTLVNGQPKMNDFWALVTNSNIFSQFPHTVLAGFSTGAFFVLGISAYHLLRKNHEELFKSSFKLATIFGLISIILVIIVGHTQAQDLVTTQPMKMAASEGLWNTMDPASMSLLTIVDQKDEKDVISIRIPYLLSLLAYDSPTGQVQGMLELNAEYQQKYGQGNYIPPIMVTYLSFRLMLAAGFLMALLALLCLIGYLQKKDLKWKSILLKVLPWAIALPYLANTTGWLMTELGRQPWVVYGLLKTADAVSPNITAGMVLFSLITFALVYGVLILADVFLLVRYAKAGPHPEQTDQVNDSLVLEN